MANVSNSKLPGIIKIRGQNQVNVNKNQKGVDKASLLQQKGISGAIFNRFDANEDGVLDQTELGNMYKQILEASGKNEQLGRREAKKLLGKDYKGDARADLAKFLDAVNTDNDNIVQATNDNNGNVTVKYKPDENGTVKTETFNDKHKLLTQREETKDGETITTTFGEDGKTPEKKVSVKGAVTTELDPQNNDRPINETIDRGNGYKVVTEFTYGDDGSKTLSTTYPDGKKIHTIKDKNGSITSTIGEDPKNNTTTEIKWNKENKASEKVITHNQGNSPTYREEHYDDQGNVKYTIVSDGTSLTRIKTENNVEQKVHVDSSGEVLDEKYQTKAGDTWYGIVQAKYGVTDHKTTMEIVHKLKDGMGIKYSSNSFPKEMKLLGSIKLANGNTVELKNIDAEVKQAHRSVTIEHLPEDKATVVNGLQVGDPSPKHKGFTIYAVRDDGDYWVATKDENKFLLCDRNGNVKEAQMFEGSKLVGTKYKNGKPTTTLWYDDQGNRSKKRDHIKGITSSYLTMSNGTKFQKSVYDNGKIEWFQYNPETKKYDIPLNK